MRAPIQLPPPSNWQDFESLCKKLWSEVWNYPETKKNGRSGQSQHGVDVWGMVRGTAEIIGIQCKGKDTYTHKQFTEAEILDEIKKAKLFQPALAKFYLATTAVKDVDIESFVAAKNIEHINQGLFEVHLYCWEDMVDELVENPRTLSWYMNSQSFHHTHEVKVTFLNGSQQTVVTPEFQRKVTVYHHQILDFSHTIASLQQFQSFSASDSIIFIRQQQEVNKSYFETGIVIHNTGAKTIEDYKVELILEGEITDMKYSQFTREPIVIHQRGIRIDPASKKVTVRPGRPILVSQDSYTSDSIFIKTPHEKGIILLHWKLLARDHNQEGVLTLQVEPQIRRDWDERLTLDPLLVKQGPISGEISDYIILVDND